MALIAKLTSGQRAGQWFSKLDLHSRRNELWLRRFMKIMIFIEELGIGGVLRQMSLLADGLARKGHDVIAFGLAERNIEWRYVWDSPLNVSVFYTEKAPNAIFRAARFVRTTATLKKLLRKEKVDVLYALGDMAKLLSWLATRGSRTTLVWGIRGSGGRFRLRHFGWKRSVLNHFSAALSRFVPLVIANFEAGQAGAERLLIHNGFDVDRFAPDPAARARVRSEWKLGGEPLIGIVGRLSFSKGQTIFLQAAALLLQRRPDARFVLVGSGPGDQWLRNLSHKLGLSERVIWAGPRRDIPAVYNALDILCSCSIVGEGCPNVVGEAMASGVPCVVTDVGAARRLVGGLCPVVPIGEPKALADALERMLGGLDAIDRRALRERMAREFSIEAMVSRTEKALLDANRRNRRIDTSGDEAIPSHHA
jgi:glycosyltransferase involved in cell wall biosynthesis